MRHPSMLEMWENLEAKGIPVDERQKYQAIAQDMGFAFADLDRAQIAPEALEGVLAAWIRCHHAMPVKRDKDVLYVAIEQPSLEMMIVLRNLGAMIGRKVVPVLAIPRAIDEAIEKYCP